MEEDFIPRFCSLLLIAIEVWYFPGHLFKFYSDTVDWFVDFLHSWLTFSHYRLSHIDTRICTFQKTIYAQVSPSRQWKMSPGYCRFVPKSCCWNLKHCPVLSPGLLCTVDLILRLILYVHISFWVWCLSRTLPHVISGSFFSHHCYLLLAHYRSKSASRFL